MTWKRSLRGRYVYLFADGLYVKAGGERDNTAVLVLRQWMSTATKSCWRWTSAMAKALSPGPR
jgi:hypothetical protein